MLQATLAGLAGASGFAPQVRSVTTWRITETSSTFDRIPCSAQEASTHARTSATSTAGDTLKDID
jgi:hypothetical protein